MTKNKYEFKCPRCKQAFKEFLGVDLTAENVSGLGALSRRGSKPTICPQCGEDEGYFDLYLRGKADSDKVALPDDPLTFVTVAEARKRECKWLEN